MIDKSELLQAVRERKEDLEEIFEESLPQIGATPIGFCGCTLFVDCNGDGDLRMTIKVGTDNENDLKSFDGDTLIDEILESSLESAIDELFADLEISSSNFEYVAEIYMVD